MKSEEQQLEVTLPGSFYLLDEHYADECKAIFHKEWFCVGRREGLAGRGDYRLVNICGESILIVCGEDATLHAFFNVCRHRGSQLIMAPDCTEQQGCFKAGIRCPYHSWNYQLDGTLHNTPHLNIDKSALGLHRVAVDCWGGFVFVRLNAEADDTLTEMLGEIPQRVNRYPLSELRTGHRIAYQVQANWKVILENYNECYHCAGVHPELCKIVPVFRKNGAQGLDWDKGIPQLEGTNTFTMDGTTKRAPFPDLDDDEQVRHKGELIYPNMMLSLSMDHAAVFYLWPRSPHHTDIVCEFLFHPDEMEKSDFDPMDAADFWDLVNLQDWAICENVQRGMQSQVFVSGYYGPMEDLSLDIRNYVRDRLNRD